MNNTYSHIRQSLGGPKDKLSWATSGTIAKGFGRLRGLRLNLVPLIATLFLDVFFSLFMPHFPYF